MEDQLNHFGDVLDFYMKQRGIKPDTLSSTTEKIFGHLEGVAKTNIVRWVNRGVARGPRDWTPIIKIAVALSLTKAEANNLLKTAGHLPIFKLARLAANIKVNEYLENWDKLVSSGVVTKIGTSLHQLPAQKRDFTGRVVELDRLTTEVQERALVGIFGAGGIGKTTLAVQLASSLKEEYPDGQLFIKLKGTDSTSLDAIDAIKWVIRSFNSETAIPENADELRSLYRSTLHGQRALLVLDDVGDAEQAGQLIPPDGCALIVTSRQWFSLPGMYPLALDKLIPAEARELFLKIAPNFQEDADEITKLCGYFPLAIRLAGSALSLPGHVTREDFMKQLRVNLFEVIDSFLHFTDEQKGVEASLKVSYELLNPEMRKRWSKLAVFSDSFERTAAAAVWRTDLTNSRTVLSTLVLCSMIEWNYETARYRLHDLMRVFAEKNLSKRSKKDCQQRHAIFYRDVLRDSNDLYQKGGQALKQGLSLFDLEWENIRYGWSWAASNIKNNNVMASVCNDYLLLGAKILRLRLPPRDRLEWLDIAVSSSQQIHRYHAKGKHLVEKGVAYSYLGELLTAISNYESAIEIFRDVGDRRNEGNTLGNLGMVYADMGEFRRAIDFYEQHLIIARELNDVQGESNALANLGNAYKNIGDLTRALKFQKHSLNLAEELGDRPGEGTSLHDIASVYLEKNQFEKAIQYYDKALSLFQEVGDLRNEGNALGNLGLAYYELGDLPSAIQYYEQALSIDKQLGNRHGASQTLVDLGKAYAGSGDPHQGLMFCNQALNIVKEIGDMRGEAEVYGNKSYCLELLGERQQAIAFAKKAYKILLELGVEDSTMKEVRENLAKWKKRQNRK